MFQQHVGDSPVSLMWPSSSRRMLQNNKKVQIFNWQSPLSFTKPCTTNPVQLKAKQGSFSFTCATTEICVFEESHWIFTFPLKQQWECRDWKILQRWVCSEKRGGGGRCQLILTKGSHSVRNDEGRVLFCLEKTISRVQEKIRNLWVQN